MLEFWRHWRGRVPRAEVACTACPGRSGGLRPAPPRLDPVVSLAAALQAQVIETYLGSCVPILLRLISPQAPLTPQQILTGQKYGFAVGFPLGCGGRASSVRPGSRRQLCCAQSTGHWHPFPAVDASLMNCSLCEAQHPCREACVRPT